MSVTRPKASIFVYFRSLLFLLPLLLLNTPTSFAQQFTASTVGNYGNVTVMEVSGNFDDKNPDGSVNAEPRQAIAREFYRLHKDEYDFLVIFTNFNFQMTLGTRGFYTGVRNDVQGIGQPMFDNTSLYGSNGVLQGTIDMGNVSSLVTDPINPKFEETMHVLSHEVMHRWGAYVKFKNADGTMNQSLLGREDSHWSFLADSGGSLLYGNSWRDNGDGTFTSTKAQDKLRYYSPLDLYLMGMYDRSQVPPMLLIENATMNGMPVDPTQLPTEGVTITGTAWYVSIDDIISAEGERIPGVAESQKKFKAAFILATAPGTFRGSEAYSIENIRNAAITRFTVQTDGRSIIEVTSTPKENLPVNPGIILPPLTLRTVPADISEGITWLNSRQNGDGHWEETSLTSLRDTTAVLESLNYFSAAQQSYMNGIAWLALTDAANTDYAARSIPVLGSGGRDVTGLVNNLLLDQNPDGGWGAKKYFMSSPLDTALSLKALASAGYANSIILSKAIDYLKSNQNPDGGWGSSFGLSSALQPTSIILSALNLYQSSYQVDQQITNGKLWVISKQNADGSYGNNPSTVYDTALAVLTLWDLDQASADINNGLAYLRNSQTGTGSWNESIYQTALAVKALWTTDVAPDLTVVANDIMFTPSVITSLPTNASITVTILNLGYSSVSQATVAIYDGAPELGNKIAEQIAAFPAQAAVSLTFQTTIMDTADHTFFVTIDPQNTINEKSKTNNVAWSTYPVNIAQLTVGFDSTGSSGAESTGTVMLPVSLSRQHDVPVNVEYAVHTASTAMNGSDFIRAAGTLTFTPGESIKYIDITVIDDGLVESDKTIVLELANPINAILGQTRHTYTIIDDDLMPVVNITSPVLGTIATDTPLLTFATSKGAATVKVDGVEVAKTSGDRLDPLTNGTHTVLVEAFDGWNTASAEVTFTIEFYPPIVSLRSPVEGVYSENNPLLTYQIDKPATVAVKIDGTVVNKIVGDRLDPLAEGEHTLQVEAIDGAGATGVAQTVFIVATGVEQPFDTVWTRATSIYAGGIAVDTWGNVYSGGSLPSNYDASLAKFDEKGNELWRRQFGSSGWDVVSDTAVDSNGNVYTAGFTWASLDGNSHEGMQDGFIVKYDTKGDSLWMRQFGTAGSDFVTGVEIDKNDNIYIAGYTGGGLFNYANGSYNYFVARYDKDGNRQWGRQINATYDQTMTDGAIAVDGNGNVYATGYSNTSSGFNKYFIVKFDASGVLLWTAQGETSASVEAYGIAVDAVGGVYVTGGTRGPLDGNSYWGQSDIFVAKYNENGNKLWTKQFGTSASETGHAIAAERNGNFYVATSVAQVIKYDSDGNQRWTKLLTVGQDSRIALGALGYLYVIADNGTPTYGAATYVDKLRDPRLPSIAFAHEPTWTISSSVTITGSIDETADITEVKLDPAATVGLVTYPTATTWQVTIANLLNGEYHIAVSAKNSEGFRDSIRSTIIKCDVLPPTINTSPLPFGIVGVAYNQTVAATDGKLPNTWTIISGALPAGLTLNDATGTISGVPATSETSMFTIQVMDADGRTNARALTLSIFAPLVINTAFLPDGSVGAAYSNALSAAGGLQTYLWSVIQGALPAGLTLNSSSGIISGTPTAGVTATFLMQVTDANGSVNTKSLSITIIAPLTISTVSLPQGLVNAAYNQTLTATGGKTPYSWSRTKGSLPGGLSLSSTGVISGTPTKSGTSNFTVQVKDEISATSTKSFSITITGALAITTKSLSNGTVGKSYRVTLAASGGTTPYTWSISSGSLPPGLALNNSTGAISGKPTTKGTFSFVATVSDANGSTAAKTLSILIR